MEASGAPIDRDQNHATEWAYRPFEKKRKRFPHGNYTGYYNTRYGREPASAADASLHAGDWDPRLNILQRSWFEGKKCLDVGCNEGHLTLAIVRRFRPRRMVGVDIDDYLIQLARDALTDEIRSAAENAKRRADRGDLDSDGNDNALERATGTATARSVSLGPGPLMPRSLRGGAGVRSAVTASAEETKTIISDACSPEEICKGGGGDRVEDGGHRKNKRGACFGSASSAALAEAVAAAEDLEKSDATRRKKGGKKKGAKTKEKTSGASDPADGHGTKKAELHGQMATAAAAFVDVEEATFLAGCAVSFWREDFVLETHYEHGYDAVCLFSVVKWMHLNGGDEALRRVFRKAHELLRPGGRLILEPQPWKSYRKSARQHGTASARANADKIRMRPSDFPEFLKSEVGFRSWEEVGMPGEGVGSFAKRSIHVFIK